LVDEGEIFWFEFECELGAAHMCSP
jgi:hypothetical protein